MKSLKTGFSSLFVCKTTPEICKTQHCTMIIGTTSSCYNWWCTKDLWLYFQEDSISHEICKNFVPWKSPANSRDKSQLHDFSLAINWSALNDKFSFAPACKFIVTAFMFILFDSHSFSLTAASTWPQLLNPYLHTCMYKENYNRNVTCQLLDTYTQYIICLTRRWSALSLLYTGTDVGFYERG